MDMTTYPDDADYVPVECDCGHTEHAHRPGGPCRGHRVVYVAADGPAPDGGTPVHTHERAAAAGMAAFSVPCPCRAFREYEGPGEPDGW